MTSDIATTQLYTSHYNINSSNLMTSFSYRPPTKEWSWSIVKSKSRAKICDKPPSGGGRERGKRRDDVRKNKKEKNYLYKKTSSLSIKGMSFNYITSSSGKTVNFQFSCLLLFITVNVLCWMDNNQLLNYRLSKRTNNFHYCVVIKTKLNNKFIVLYCFLSPKQHETINLSFCIIFKPQNNTNNKFIILCQYLSFQKVNLLYQTVNLSFYVVL